MSYTEFRLSSERVHMLRKSSKCDEGKKIHSSDFNGEKLQLNKKNSFSSDFVSHLINFINKNVDYYKLIHRFYISYKHRATAISAIGCLYDSQKQVFLYSKLASNPISLNPSEFSIKKNFLKKLKTFSALKLQTLNLKVKRIELIEQKMLYFIIRFTKNLLNSFHNLNLNCLHKHDRRCQRCQPSARPSRSSLWLLSCPPCPLTSPVCMYVFNRP